MADHKPPSKRSCDRCRHRKIGCDRTYPCSACRCAGADCKTTPLVGKGKQRRVLISSEYEQKLDRMEESLNRVVNLVENFQTTSPARSIGSIAYIPKCSTSPNSSTRQASIEGSTNICNPNSNVRPSLAPAVVTAEELAIEGQSSMAAHSTFAINLVHRLVGSRGGAAANPEIVELLSTLRQIGEAFANRRPASKLSLPSTQILGVQGHEGYELPPLQAAVHALQNAQDSLDEFFLGISWLLNPRSLSDVCLKVYFSPQHLDAEFIILNAALYFLAPDLKKQDDAQQEERQKVVSLCQVNLETAIAKLPLCLNPTYDMVLALLFGAIYALDVSKPSLAWSLISAASQSSRSLGFHMLANRPSGTPNEDDQKQLLYCAVYCFEKSLCLRLGHSSTIPDYDIPLLWSPDEYSPASFPLSYIHQNVRLASLIGRIYALLYSASALRLSAEVQSRHVLDLAQELIRYHMEIQSLYNRWLESTTDSRVREQIEFSSESDNIQYLTLLTLIYRATPPQLNSPHTFSSDCINTARLALESHESVVRELQSRFSSSIISAYVNWTIAFTPFVPFIVLFCHAIETGDEKDLAQMRVFVNSMESSCQHSAAIAKHHRLFEVFYGVAVKYNELRPSSESMHDEYAEIRNEVDAQLNALGLQLQTNTGYSAPVSGQVPLAGYAGVNHSGQGQAIGEHVQLGTSLEGWVSFNQHIMGLLDDNDLPF